MTHSDYLTLLARMNAKKPGAQVAGVQSEAHLHELIYDECRRRGWIAFHGAMSERTHRTLGEPDFVILADAGRFLLVECKSATGKLRPEQAQIAAWAQKLGHTIHVVRSLEEFLTLCTPSPQP